MHQGHLAVVGGLVVLQPRHQIFHGLDVVDLGGAVLLGPAAHLTLEVVARLAVIGEAHRVHVHAVQRRQHPVHLIVHGGALGVVHFRNRRVPEDPALAEFHDVEHGADHVAVLAQVVHARHRHVGVLEGIHDPEFPVHGVGGLEQLTRRLTAQHVFAGSGLDVEGGVGLTAFEFIGGDRAFEAGDVRFQIGREALGIQGIHLGHVYLLKN